MSKRETDSGIRDSIDIPDNVLMEGIKGYKKKDQEDLLWLLTYGAEKVQSRDALCSLLGCDWTTVVRICSGKYGASIKGFMAKVRDLKRRAADNTETGFVETLVTKKISAALDYALAGNLRGGHMVLISGPSGRSKTETVKEWCRNNNHGKSIYVDAPVSGGLRALLQEIARKTRITGNLTTDEMSNRIFKSFNRNRILILDEVVRLLPKGKRIPTELEFVRRLHDTTGCAVALIATPTFLNEASKGRLRIFFEQILGRLDPLQIPLTVFKAEVRDICGAFCKGAVPADLVKLGSHIANQPGRLRVFFDLMQKASFLAGRKKEKLSAKHLQTAYNRRRNRNDWPTEE